MRKRSIAIVGALAMLVLGSATTVGVAGQTPAAAGGRAAATTTSRTPWGDPDLQGIWTNSAEAGTPFEKPAEYQGKTEAELRQVLNAKRAKDATPEARRKREEEFDQSAGYVGREKVAAEAKRGGGTGNGPVEWYEHLNPQNSRLWSLVDPPDGKMPALTDQAKKRAAAQAEHLRQTHTPDPDDVPGRYLPDGPEDMGLGNRCMQGVRMYAPSYYNNNMQIVQSPGYVVILYEWFHDARVIPTDGRPPVGHTQMSGNSRGHWEGNTLVVETSHVSPESPFRGADPATLRLTERFTRTAANTIDYQFTANDPNTWVKPWTAAIPWTRDDTQDQIFEYACHEGNYGLRNILSAARAREKQLAAGAAKKK